MKTLLQIHSSLNGKASLSSALAGDFVDGWVAGHPGARVIHRDLAQDPVPHLTAADFQAFTTAPDQRDAGAVAAVARSDALIAELRGADVLVLGVPMYNFGVPSTLKAWFDQLARAGETFRYTPDGPVGLVTGKRGVVFATRGGAYVGTGKDTQTTYIQNFLAFLGIEDVEFVYAEGTAMGDAHLAATLAQARRRIETLTPRFAA